MTQPDVIARLSKELAALPAESLETPSADRVGAVLVLVEPGDVDDATLVYTLRRDDLRSHPGQISFPGGRVDPGETVEQAAVREAHEEVALDPRAVEVMGRLPAFYIPPSRFWIQPVLAHWLRPHPLTPAESEVAAVLHVPLARLRDSENWRAVGLSSVGWSWAWDLGDGHLLWGATAIVTAVLLGLLDPDWNGGAVPADYQHRQARPWERERRVVDRRLPARLTGRPEQGPDGLVADPVIPPDPSPQRVAAAAVAIAHAARELAAGHAGPVVVLAGSGATGTVGRAVADAIVQEGLTAVVVDPASFTGTLPADPSVLVDALTGTGLVQRLHGPVLDVLRAMQLRARPVVSVDVPSGLHPTAGIVGDIVTADVTIAIGAIQPGLLAAGMAPFVGDLYVAPLQPEGPELVRVVGDAAAPTWRE